MKGPLLIPFMIGFCSCISDWRPVLQPDLYPGLKGRFPPQSSLSSLSTLVQSYQQPGPPHAGGQCELYKVGFLQDLYFQYIQYKINLPELKEFTLCYWSKFANHSNDHPIFSYAVDGQPKSIAVWISNTDRSSYFSLSVEGHTFYRLNYPLRLNRWYHTCQSWNGRTGEWQIWVNAERVGRGFHNRLVGHVIPSGGIAITGQQQTQYGGGFLEGVEAPKGSGGMLGEVTMVQLYKVALTAGKAHRDHKHHHAHEFDHNGQPITTTPPPPRPPRPLTPTHPLITGGQLNPNIALSIATGNAPPQPQMAPQIVPGQTFDVQFLNGQFVNNLVAQQFGAGARGPQQFIAQNQPGQPRQPSVQFLPQQPIQQPFIPAPQISLMHPSLLNPANVQIIDTQLETHQLFKRDNINDSKAEETTKADKKKPAKEKNLVKLEETKSKELNPVEEAKNATEKKQSKRELILQGGTIVDDGLPSNLFDQTLLHGLAGIGQNEPVLQIQKQYDEREPAEAEVMAVMNVCSGCDEEPFAKALVFGWRSVAKKLYSGAFYMPALPRCKSF